MAAGGSGGELARPETTGYGHSGWEEVDDSGTSSGPREDSRHVNEIRLEPHEWGEARSDRHGDPTQGRAPAGRPVRPLMPPPKWPLRTKAGVRGWRDAFFGVEKKGEGEEMGARTKTTVTAKAAKDGIPAGHKKIINEVLAKEDAKPTGDAVRMAVSNPRREFARYQVPTDRGLKDIEIFDGRVKVRSESTYGFRKAAEDGADGLPDRVAPPDEAEALGEAPIEVLPDDEMLPDEEPDEAAEGPEGLRLHVDIVATPPDGMEEEDVISILDEALLDPDIADAINAKLEGSGVTLRVLEVETYEEDECMPTPGEDEMTEIPVDEGTIDEIIDEDAIEEIAAK